MPGTHDGTIQKCRIIYGKTIEMVEFLPYEYKTLSKLKVVNADDILYSYKYEDRSMLIRLFESKGGCDDILIIKNNLVTDSYYANVVLYDGYDWVTPSNPLLKGTQRAHLLEKGVIKEKKITLESLKACKKIRFINAMVSFNDAGDIDINNLIF